MKIYLSSTYLDLKDYRTSVYQTLCKIEGIHVVAMENYVACDERPVNKCLDDVEKCDVYIGLFAWRYGFIPVGYSQSITHLEYLKSFEANKPIFIFLLDDKYKWPDSLIDRPNDNIINLRNELKNTFIVSYFQNKEDLAKEVAIVISNYIIKHKTINQGISYEEYFRVSKELGVTENAVKSFFKIIEQNDISKEDWNTTLIQIATRHKELISRLDQFNYIDEEIQELRLKAEVAIKDGKYNKAYDVLDVALEKQISYINNAQKELNSSKISAVELYADKGTLELIRINYKSAYIYFKKAVELIPDGYNLKRALYLQKYGEAAFYAGFFQESQNAFEKCLEIRNKFLPKDDLDIASSLNKLALLYKFQGKFNEALQLFHKCLEIIKTKLGKDHPDVAYIINNLGGIYESQGKYEEAENLLKKSLEIIGRKLGEDHPNNALFLNNLANLYESQNQYVEAIILYNRSLEIKEKVFGKDHISVAIILNNLALLFKTQGKYEQAKFMYFRSLEIKEKYFGKNHPCIATTYNNLAGLFKCQGKYEQAESLYKKDLEITEKSLGKKHPSVAITLNNLALLYKYQGKQEEAELLFKRSLMIRESTLGKDHPCLTITLNNLAGLYRSQCRYEEAGYVLKRNFEILTEKAIENIYPRTTTVLNNLVQLYNSQGKFQDAEPLFMKGLDIYEKPLGKDFPIPICKKQNNVNILIYGGIGSGKSTIIAALSLYLIFTEGLPFLNNDQINSQSINNFNNLLIRFKNNRFPIKTIEDSFIRLDLDLTKKHLNENFGFSFFEASGEGLIKIDPINERREDSEEILLNWVDLSDIIFIVAPSESNDMTNFYLHSFINNLLFQGITNKPIGFILSKYDLIESTYPNHKDFGTLYYKSSIDLLDSNQFTNKRKIFPFSIGKVKINNSENIDFNGFQNEIELIDFLKGAKNIADWIFEVTPKKN